MPTPVSEEEYEEIDAGYLDVDEVEARKDSISYRAVDDEEEEDDE